MNDEDDLLDDNFLTSDFLDALERQESQFYSTQQGATTRVGEASMSAAPRIAPVIMRDPNVVEATSNARVWDSTSREDIESQLKEKTQVIDNLRFAVDQLRSKVIHDETLRDNALRELERFRTELNFKSHELDSARRELHALKVKHARTEEPTPSYDNARQSNTNSRKRSTFPDTMAFIPSKRANYRRATPAPSTSPMSVALESISSAAPTITSPQKEPTPVLIPPLQEKTVPHPTKNQGKILLKHLLRKVYEEWCREQHQPFDHHFYESPTLTSELCTKLAHKLMPAEYVTEGHRKLAMLASDLVQCMAMVSYKDVAIVIQQMMSILGLCISISRKEKLINVFRQAVNIIHTLTSSYKESSQYLLSDLHRADNSSTLWQMADGLALFAIRKMEQNSRTAKMMSLVPEAEHLTFAALSSMMEAQNISPLELRDIISSPCSREEALQTIHTILDIYGHVASGADDRSIAPFHFLARHSSFLHLFNSPASLCIVIHSLQIALLLITDAWSSGIVNGTPSFVESLISVFHFQRPIQYDEEVKWYKARSEALSIYGSMLSRQFPDEIESEMRMMFLSSLLHTVKIECWRLQTSAEPPFPRIAEEQNEKLLLQCSSLVMVIFTQHPGIFDEDQMEEPITEALSMLSAVTQEAWGSHHQIHSIIRKILKKLQAYRNKKTSKHLQNSSPMIID